jgi:peptidoglycan/xylan/chitin deacetylase (PgdA/CDA1 family)
MTRRSFCAGVATVSAASAQTRAGFVWPEGRKCAVSLTFDDARLSQVDVGLSILKEADAKCTFYLVPDRAKQRLAGWKQAVADGHEIGNHTRLHPCTGNYAFSKAKALENLTLERMAEDIDGCNSDLTQMLGVKPVSFAYPCGQKFVGRGENVKSYVPVIAKRFLTGRGYLDESPNDPAICDFAALMGTGFDGLTFDEMQRIVTAARNQSRWVVFVGHEIGKSAHQTTDTGALRQLIAFAKDPSNGIWMDTVETIARYIKRNRREL